MRTAISEVGRYFTKENALKWLNIASHEGATRKLRESTESRQKALNPALTLGKVIPLILQNLPEPIVITKKVGDAKTGVEYYEAELITGRTLKIYGTRFVELQFPYYFIPRFLTIFRTLFSLLMFMPIIPSLALKDSKSSFGMKMSVGQMLRFAEKSI